MKELLKKITVKFFVALGVAILLYPFTTAVIIMLAYKLRGH